MKYSLIILLSFIFFMNVQSQIQGSYNWEEVIYHYQTGSVPPPYFHEYNLSIKKTGEMVLHFQFGYSADSINNLNYTFKLNSEKIDSLNSAMNDLELLTKTIEKVPDGKTPVGGSISYLTIKGVMDKEKNELITIKTPPFPKNEADKEKLKGLYEQMKSFVPKETLEEINTKKHEYEKNYKKK